MKSGLTLILISLIYYPLPVFAQGPLKRLQTFEVKGIRISDTEACRKARCVARKFAGKPSVDSEPAIFSRVKKNPASDLCAFLQGKPETFLTDSRDEIEVCRFGDGSYLVSWDLLRKKFGGELR